MMWNKIASNRVLIYLILMGAAYWVIAAFVPPKILVEVLDSLFLPLGILTLVVFTPLAFEEMFKPRLDRTGRLLVGIVLGWSATTVLRGLAIYGRSFGRLTEFIESPYFGFFIWILVWASILHITAPYADLPVHKQPYNKWLLLAVVLGALLGGFFLGVQAGFWFDHGIVDKPMTG